VDLTPDTLAFLAERHLATLTTLRPDGSPHVVAVGFTYADGVARVITDGASRKARNVREHVREGSPRAVVAQVDGARWLALEGTVTVSDDAERVARAVALYAERYRPPRENPTRVVLEITVDRVLGRP
jgi:PPOX class probable F420-dependent enzyme